MKAPRKRWPKGTWMRLRSGLLLRDMMDRQHLSNADVARHAGVQRTFISALVNERRTSCKWQTAELIAERMNVPVESLFVPKESAASGNNAKSRKEAA